MSTAMPDLRTPVMIVVDVSWEDEGTLQATSARMEDKSSGGACIRVKKAIPTGSKIWIKWRFDQFSGIVKYCRTDEREYLVGVQRDVTTTPAPALPPPAETPAQQPSKLSEFPSQKFETPATMHPPGARDAISRRPFIRALNSRSRANVSHPQEFTGSETQPPPESPPQQEESNRKRKFMEHKWLDKAPWHHKQDQPSTSSSENNGARGKENSVPALTASPEKAAAPSREVPSLQVELLPMEDIYIAAGINAPRKGYSVKKVVEMLNSEHIRNLSKELKRASVLMALDAAGVSLDQIQHDAKARHDALNAYEAEQKKQAETVWARRAEEVAYIQSQLENIKVHYMSRINRTVEGVARDKARFSNWQTMKQEEAQSMTEALDLCLKSHITEPASLSSIEAAAAASATPKAQ